MHLTLHTISNPNCRLALLHEFSQDDPPFLNGEVEQVGHMLENVRDNEDLVFQVSVVIMMLSNRLG